MENGKEITQENEFTPVQKTGVTEMLVSRQAQEVQAAIVIAKRFPRDEARAYDRIIRACQRKGLADVAEYTYPRGKEKINGPSIRLAEVLAQNWENIDYGIIELAQFQGKSEMMAYAWDLETNYRVTKIFCVKHRRETKSGGYDLNDSRDIYEMTANWGSRRVRACIMALIPGDVQDAAIRECRKTLTGSYKEPLETRIRKMVTVFEKDFLVSQKQIEEYLGFPITLIDENVFLRMQGVYRSLRDGMSAVGDFFKITPKPTDDPFAEPVPESVPATPPEVSPTFVQELGNPSELTPEEKKEYEKEIAKEGKKRK